MWKMEITCLLFSICAYSTVLAVVVIMDELPSAARLGWNCQVDMCASVQLLRRQKPASSEKSAVGKKWHHIFADHFLHASFVLLLLWRKSISNCFLPHSTSSLPVLSHTFFLSLTHMWQLPPLPGMMMRFYYTFLRMASHRFRRGWKEGRAVSSISPRCASEACPSHRHFQSTFWGRKLHPYLCPTLSA